MKLIFPCMRKIVLFFLVIIGSLITASAQEQQTNTETSLTPKFGLKGGINLSNLYIDDADDENMKLGINLGLYSKIPLTKGLSIQPELIYSSKGAKLTYNNFILGKGEYRFNLNYVELPVLAVINLANNFNLQGGAYLSYLVSANIKDVEDNGSINNIKDLEAENFNRLDYGLVGGLGVDVKNITIGARYSYGLKEVGESGSLSGNLTRDSKNSVISVYVGFGF